MRISFHIILFLTVAAFAVSCQRGETDSCENVKEETYARNSYVPGKARIKVTEELAASIAAGETFGTSARRAFPHGGRYEERMRKAGLHLWYDIEIDGSEPLTKTGESLLDIEGVEIVEFIPILTTTATEHFFNDPDLRRQWHYVNAGNPVTGLHAGCDINILPAWERGITGNENVIVAVLDTGIDINHEDLKDNIWQGTDENGKTINGYNFFGGSSTIIAEDHGTHVAGTIAAVNNNGIGVSGIAGGDAAEGIKGVRLMSCQILDGDHSGNAAEALVWAANHGAVIAQNSWSYLKEVNEKFTDTPRDMKEAIEYFNTYAGCDEEGNQLPDSPMKGGVVIFAAGNDASSVSYPSSYEGCIAVSALAGDYTKAHYSNYGDWVDIAAPGGDAYKNHMVYSTVVKNSYDGLQGTSMACPHVSGVAALIVSEFGGQGFTREELIERLLVTATDISLPANEMGAGLVNASAALARYGEHLPDTPEFAGYEELSGSTLTLKYLMPEENHGVELRSVELFYSLSPFSEKSETLSRISQKVGNIHAGDTIRITLNNVDFNTTYYFSIEGCDAFGNTTKMSGTKSVTTRDNLPPVIEAENGTEFTFRQYMQPKLKFTISDPENHLKDVIYRNATEHDRLAFDNGRYILTIDAQQIPAGGYVSGIIASDAYGKTTECVIRFTIEENIAPVVTKQIENIVFSAISGNKTIKLSEHISDADGETPTYTVESGSESVVRTSVSNGTLTLTSSGFGEAQITVTATDTFRKSVQLSFKVLVRDGSRAFDIYPNPVRDGKLHIRASKADEASISISGTSGAVVHESVVLPDPFNPAVVDMTDILPGTYNVKVTDSSGKTFTQNIVRL